MTSISTNMLLVTGAAYSIWLIRDFFLLMYIRIGNARYGSEVDRSPFGVWILVSL